MQYKGELKGGFNKEENLFAEVEKIHSVVYFDVRLLFQEYMKVEKCVIP